MENIKKVIEEKLTESLNRLSAKELMDIDIAIKKFRLDWDYSNEDAFNLHTYGEREITISLAEYKDLLERKAELSQYRCECSELNNKIIKLENKIKAMEEENE